MSKKYLKRISLLNDNEKIKFYELLTHKLTVSIRAIIYNKETSSKEKLDQVKWLNEIIHELVQRTSHLRLGCNSRTDEEFYKNTKHWIQQNKSIHSDVSWAFTSSFDALKKTKKKK